MRERLREKFNVIAPCTHQARCGILTPGNEHHWCHHFAPPPPGVFTDGHWAKFGELAGVDLRSLPVSFLLLDRRLEHNPAEDIRPPRAWSTLPRFLSMDEVDRLIAQPDASTPRGLRDRALIELVYATGMRVSELVGVRAMDLHLDELYLTCIGKGDKERLIPIGDAARVQALPLRIYRTLAIRPV